MFHRISNIKGRRVVVALLIPLILTILFLLIINCYVISSTNQYILSSEEASSLPDMDCILVLGCGVKGDTPSPMLADRLKTSTSLYELGASDKLLMSGDHGRPDYDEVSVMKHYAINSGIPSQQVFKDNAGFSTYESLYRAKDIFCAKRIIIVTQGYHLYRSLYIARALGLTAYGVEADSPRYPGQSYRDFREALARVKDVFYIQLKPTPTNLGAVIPVSGNGDLTNN